MAHLTSPLIGMSLHHELKLSANHTQDVAPQILGGQSLTTATIDDFTVAVHDVVVLHQLLAGIKVVALNLLLSALQTSTNYFVLDGRLLVQAQRVHDAGN